MPAVAVSLATGYGAVAIPFTFVFGVLSGNQTRFVAFFLGMFMGLTLLLLVGLLVLFVVEQSWLVPFYGLSIPFALLSVFKAGTFTRVRIIDSRRHSHQAAT